MKKSTSTALTFSIRQYSDNGYNFTEIHIRESYVRSVEKQIDGCVDNKAGYQSFAIAQRQEAKFRRILAAGHVSIYDSVHYGLEATIRFQHYVNPEGKADGYCDPTFDSLGRDFGAIEKGVKFLRKLGNTIEKLRTEAGSAPRKVSSISFQSPERLIAALVKLKAVEITYDRELDDCIRVLSPKAESEAA